MVWRCRLAITICQQNNAPLPRFYQTLCKSSVAIVAGANILQTLDMAKRQLLTGGFTKIDYLDLRDATSLTPL